jgi:hypothetical protein
MPLRVMLRFSLQRIHILCLRAFLTLSHIHRNFLAFVKSFSSGTVNCAKVDEYVLATFLLNETETFLIIEPLNSTFYLL